MSAWYGNLSVQLNSKIGHLIKLNINISTTDETPRVKELM